MDEKLIIYFTWPNVWEQCTDQLYRTDTENKASLDEYTKWLLVRPAVYSCPVSDLGVRASTERVRVRVRAGSHCSLCPFFIVDPNVLQRHMLLGVYGHIT